MRNISQAAKRAIVADYRVLVTGSRTWEDKTLIAAVLDGLLAEHGCLTLVHGACPKGADRIAHNWGLDARYASSFGAVTIEPHPADWKSHGRAAGFTRNAEMVALGADLCLCFGMPCSDHRCYRSDPHISHGAAHCAGLAEEAAIEVRRFAPSSLPLAALFDPNVPQ